VSKLSGVKVSKVVTLTTYLFLHTEYIREENVYKGIKLTPKLKLLNKKDTYIMVFHLPIQQAQYDCVLKIPGIKIIYTSPLAVNTQPGHGQHPRNKVVVFELE